MAADVGVLSFEAAYDQQPRKCAKKLRIPTLNLLSQNRVDLRQAFKQLTGIHNLVTPARVNYINFPFFPGILKRHEELHKIGVVLKLRVNDLNILLIAAK
jgi:hypothetical protein